jgi:hypothetical protein
LSPRRALSSPLIAALLLAAPVTAQAPAGLRALPHVAIDVIVSPEHPDVAGEALATRLEAALRAARPAPAIDPGSPDVLRLAVSVLRVSAIELRGFYLPFSGFYGIGSVRLAVERAVSVPEVAEPVRAVVWQAERPVRGPWQQSGAAVTALADTLVAAFLEDYRRAVGP